MYLVIDSKKHKHVLNNIPHSKLMKMNIIDRQKNPKKVDAMFGKLQKPVMFGNNLRNDSIPLPNWGGFSASPGNNRGGNAINCKESADWLYKNRSPNLYFGEKLPPSVNVDIYNHRGKTGFEQVPKGIYQFEGGPVLNYSYSPYTGSRTPGILPQPYGPIDNVAIKGFPNANNALPGKQALMRSLQFGQSEFRPSPNQKRIPGYTTYANHLLYEPGWNPYQINGRTKQQQQVAKASKKISEKWANNVARYGNYPTLYQSSGPNNVAYRNPFLMYDGAGGNTKSFLRGVDYLPSGKKLSKVQANNNPTGVLAQAIPISRAGKRVQPKKQSKKQPKKQPKKQQPKKSSSFGKWSNPNEPWVMKNTERPFTTELVSPNIGTTTGPTRLGQPLDLYTYQNTPFGKTYPASLGPRMWYGGFGQKKKKKTTVDDIDGGDTVVINSKGKIQSIKKAKK